MAGPEWAQTRRRHRRLLAPFRRLNQSLGLLLSIALSRLAQVASVWTQITAAPYSFAAKPNLSNWRLSQKAIHPKTACPTLAAQI